MKIASEVWLVVAIIAFLLAYLIDRIAGPVTILVGNPVAFLTSTTLIAKYPLTTASIAIRAFALFLSTMLVISLMEGKYFAKAVALLFVGILAEFYAIQQLATGFTLTTIQWTLSIAYGSVLLILGIISMILKGIWTSFNPKAEPQEAQSDEKSILEP